MQCAIIITSNSFTIFNHYAAFSNYTIVISSSQIIIKKPTTMRYPLIPQTSFSCGGYYLSYGIYHWPSGSAVFKVA